MPKFIDIVAAAIVFRKSSAHLKAEVNKRIQDQAARATTFLPAVQGFSEFTEMVRVKHEVQKKIYDGVFKEERANEARIISVLPRFRTARVTVQELQHTAWRNFKMKADKLVGEYRIDMDSIGRLASFVYDYEMGQEIGMQIANVGPDASREAYRLWVLVMETYQRTPPPTYL